MAGLSRSAAVATAYPVAYVAAVVVGRVTAIHSGGLPLFWPAAGVAALWLLSSRGLGELLRDGLVLMILGSFTEALLDVDTGVAIVLTLGDLLAALALRAVWARYSSVHVTAALRPRLSTPRDLAINGLGSLAAALTSIPVAIAACELLMGGWTVGDVSRLMVRTACGALVIVTSWLTISESLTSWRGHRPTLVSVITTRERERGPVELAVTTGVLIALGYFVFANDEVRPVSFVMTAGAAWVGYRFTPLVCGVYTLIAGTVAVVTTELRTGVFGLLANPDERAVLVQLFVALTAVVTLMLSLGTAERWALVRRVEASERESRSQAYLLGAVTESMVDGLVVIAKDGRLVVANPAIYKMAGALTGDPDMLQSAEDHGLFEADGSPLANPPHLRAFRGEISPPRDMLHVDPTTGHQSILQVNTVPLELPLSDPRGADPTRRPEVVSVNLVRDVTNERARTRELDGFASVVAHDLSNPLMAVQNWAEILDDQLEDLGVDVTEAKASLVRIYSSADAMKALIADLLTLAQTGSMVLDPVVLDLGAIVDDLTSYLQGTGETPVVRHDSLDLVSADPTLVRQTLSNLLGNAVKYVAPGTRPRVDVSTRKSPQDDAMVEISVSDNGIGIPAAEQGRVFDSFFRGAESRVDYPGTGLGLAISARAVGRLGGEISARTGPDGVGTTITFTLPGVDGSPE